MIEVKEVSVGSIQPYKNNPRVIPEQAVRSVAESIDKFGFQQPIVVDPEGVIVVGHTRLLAAKYLGLKKVPVVYADLNPNKARAYRIIDNQVGEIAKWDEELLRIESAVFNEIEYNSLIDELDDEMSSEVRADIDFLSDLSGGPSVDNTEKKEMIGNVGNYVTMSFVMLPADRDMILEGLRGIQASNGLENTTQALIKIMKEFR